MKSALRVCREVFSAAAGGCTELPDAQGQPVAAPVCPCGFCSCWEQREELLGIAPCFAPFFYFPSLFVRLGNDSCWLQLPTGLRGFGAALREH